MDTGLISFNWHNNYPNIEIAKTQSLYFSFFLSDSVFFDTLGVATNQGSLLARMYNEPQTAKSLKLKELHIYPNSSDDYITIELENGFNKATIEIFNSASIKVRKYEVRPSILKVSIKDLKQGIYIIKLTTPKEVRTSKFLKI